MSRSSARSHSLLATLLAALAMIGPFSIDAVFPGFPGIAAEFGVPAAAVQQTVSVYLLAYAFMSLFHGALSDAYGRKPVIVVGMALYAVASAGAAMADSFGVLLVSRALQGMCAGSGMVVGRAMVRDTLEGAEAQKLMSRVMMIFGIAPAIAPIVGAWLLGVDGWRGIFWALMVFAAAMSVVCAVLMQETHPAELRTRFAPRPLMHAYRSIVSDGMFWLLAIAGTVNFSALFLYIASAPVVVRDQLGLGPDGFPWLFVPVVVGLVGGGALSGRMAGRISTARTVGLGYVLMFVACGVHVALALGLPHPMVPWTTLPLALQSIGVQLAYPTIILLLLDRFPHQRGAAASVQAFVSLLINAAVAGVLSPLLSSHMLTLALGSTAVLLSGLVAWQWFRRGAVRGR